MQAYAAGLARAVRMPEDEIPGLVTATLLHDIGNLGVPEHIFSKPGPLTFEEFQRVKIHPRVGAQILKNVPFPYPVADLIAAHHEHWDGTGYPAGLAGEAIPLGARVLAVVDSYASLSCDRPHRPARPHHEVLEVLRRTAGTILDPGLVEPFIKILPVLEFQFAGDAAARRPAPDEGLPGGPEPRREASALEDIATAHHEARALYEIAQALGASLDVTETMGLITANLNDLVPFSCSALFLLKEETGRFECRWASGLHDRELRQVAVGSVDELERVLPTLGPAGDSEPGLHSALVSPLVVGDQVIGALAIFHTAADAYLQDHRRVFRRVAEHASLVIHNSIVFERAQEASFTDQLTRLPNRRYMLLYLTQQMARAEQTRSKLAVLMFDLNGFKAINDALGHQAGDRALHEVAAVLRSMVRSYDLCVRYGGDEFVAILWECDAENAEQRRLEMERAVAATYFEGRPGEAIPLSASAGIAVYPEDGRTHEELIAVADRRMYQRKAKRKDSLTQPPVSPTTT
jgi:diguanylate cyclase (GGDEF)-like protein